MKQVEKLKARLRSRDKRIRDLELACTMFMRETSRLRGIIHEEQAARGVFDYAAGM